MKSVILTNASGQDLGREEIIAAHTNGGKLHQAFSVVVFNSDHSKMLIQKRAEEKMLFADFFANTCCSHPKGEASIEEEAAARLMEECGFTCPLSVHSSFVYKADDPNGNGTEHEYDTILIGEVDENTVFNPDPAEVEELKWISIDELRKSMEENPNIYAPWFHKIKNILMTNN